MTNWILQNLFSVIGLSGYALVGFFAMMGYFKKNIVDERQNEADKVGDVLINRLKDTVDQQEKTITKMLSDMKEHTEKRDKEMSLMRDDLHKMKGRNELLEELFKGRDPAMQDFLKNAPMLVQIVKENNGLAKDSSEALTHLTDTIASFVNSLQPILIHLELSKSAVKV